jgi:hypothetical protein
MIPVKGVEDLHDVLKLFVEPFNGWAFEIFAIELLYLLQLHLHFVTFLDFSPQIFT